MTQEARFPNLIFGLLPLNSWGGAPFTPERDEVCPRTHVDKGAVTSWTGWVQAAGPTPVASWAVEIAVGLDRMWTLDTPYFSHKPQLQSILLGLSVTLPTPSSVLALFPLGGGGGGPDYGNRP